MKNNIKSNCIKAGIFVIFSVFFFLNIESGFANNGCNQKLDSLHILLSESTTPKSKADCYADIAHIYYTCDQIPQAIYNYKIAASIYLKENMFDQYCYQLESLGVMHAVSNDPKMGLFYFFKALEVTEKYHLDKMHYYSLIQNIGNMYMEAEEWTKGIKYYKLCESYFSSDSCKNKKYIIVNQTNIGYAYQKINLIDSALPYYDSAIKNSNKYSIKNYLSGIMKVDKNKILKKLPSINIIRKKQNITPDNNITLIDLFENSVKKYAEKPFLWQCPRRQALRRRHAQGR